MFSTTDVGNTAFWCLLMFGFIFMMGAPVGGMLLALGAVFLVACMLHK